VKVLLVLGAAVAMSGCSLWYKPEPVANAIGEEKTVLAGDSVHVYRESRFEVYGPNPEAVYDGYEQLSRAYRSWGRHFGEVPPRLAFVLFPDSLERLDSAVVRGFTSRGFSVITYVRPKSVRTRRRYGGINYGGVLWPIAPTAARVMLARFAATHGTGGPPRSDDAELERFPVWYRAAVIHLVGEAGAFASDVEYVREKRHQWWPFRDMLTLVRPPGVDSLLDPSRRGEADDGTRIIASQSSALGRFLAEQEGPAVLGRLGRGYLSGRSLPEMLQEFKVAPQTIVELEQRWKNWIDAFED
jgi:hypothetical protein